MARARAEQQPATTGMTLIVLVGLGVAFLLFMAFLNVVKTGNVLTESNLLYAALIFYAGAGSLYLGFGVTGTESYVKFASLATWAGLLANTGAVAHRWYAAGHPHTTGAQPPQYRSEEHTSELQSRGHSVCRLLLE